MSELAIAAVVELSVIAIAIAPATAALPALVAPVKSSAALPLPLARIVLLIASTVTALEPQAVSRSSVAPVLAACVRIAVWVTEALPARSGLLPFGARAPCGVRPSSDSALELALPAAAGADGPIRVSLKLPCTFGELTAIATD